MKNKTTSENESPTPGKGLTQSPRYHIILLTNNLVFVSQVYQCILVLHSQAKIAVHLINTFRLRQNSGHFEQNTLKIPSLELKALYYYSNSAEICFQGYNQQEKTALVQIKVLAWNGQQAVIWTNASSALQYIYVYIIYIILYHIYMCIYVYVCIYIYIYSIHHSTLMS